MKETNKKEVTMDVLAGMVQKGFLGVEAKIEEVKKELKETGDDLKADLNKKVDIFTYKDLEFRVERLEETKIANKR